MTTDRDPAETPEAVGGGAGGEWAPLVAELERRRSIAEAMGGEERLARRAVRGVLHARARITALLDPGSFTEVGRLAGDEPAAAFVAGTGRIDGRPCAVGAEDFTVLGGSIGRQTSAKRHRLVELALQEQMPVVLLLEGAGHRPPLPGDGPGVRAPNDLQALADASGNVPIAVGVFGPSAGHGALAAPLADFTVMTPDAAIFTAGPPLVRASLGEEITKEALGGPDVALSSGVIHNAADNDVDAIEQIRRWLSHLPTSSQSPAPLWPPDDGERATPELAAIVPRNPRSPYDMTEVISVVVDDGSWFEVQPHHGRSLLTGLARIEGRSVAIVANQPAHMAGTIDASAAAKAARFITMADDFNLALVFLTDNPGVLAGSASEQAGILRHAGEMFKAQHRARVPKLQVTLRKAYGFGSSVMAMNPFSGQTLNVAWPGVTFGAMPARGADEATHATAEERQALIEAELASSQRSAASMSIDELIRPDETRNALIRGLRSTAGRTITAR